MSLRDRLMPQDQLEPPPLRLSYHLVALHGGQPDPGYRTSSVIEAVTRFTDLLAVATPGVEIHAYVSAAPVTLAEVEAAVRAGDTDEALALLEQFTAQRQGVAP
jgi:hypothetical protein